MEKYEDDGTTVGANGGVEVLDEMIDEAMDSVLQESRGYDQRRG